MIPLTEEQRLVVRHPDNVTVTACPGSGKTRVILAKLLSVAEQVVDTPRSIACITYTNAAVEEIESRLKQYGDHRIQGRSEVATIHSFCLQFILRPYVWLLPEVPNQFSILTQQMGAFEQIIEAVEDELNRPIGPTTYDDYGSLRTDCDGNPVGQGTEGGVVTAASARRYWEVCRNRGLIDFSMILYLSLRILREHPFVGRGLAARFRWFLIDEFQDTTDVQIEIVRQFAQFQTSGFFLVGDTNQSIQGFAGARPDLALAFSGEIGARQDLSLTGNFRSSAQVVSLAERTIARIPAMTAVGIAADFQAEPSYYHASCALDAITDTFLPMLAEHNIPLGNAAVLAPWWQHLIPVARNLRGFDIPVFGPGARPYKRSRLFAVLAEQLGACAEAEHFLGVPGAEKALFHLISEATGSTRFDLFSYEGRRTVMMLIYEARRLVQVAAGGEDWLRSMAEASTRILTEENWLPLHAAALLPQSVDDMIGDMERQGVDVANLQVADLGLFADPNNALKLLTLHRAKGREFDAVALIHMNDGQLPHWTAREQHEIDEGRRLFYVGLTRAKKLLIIVSDYSNHRNRPTRYLRECGLR